MKVATGRRARFAERASGTTIRQICRQLNADAVPTPTGNRIGELREALLADGYESAWEPTMLLPNYYTARCEILPTDVALVPPAAEISASRPNLPRGYASVLPQTL